MILYTTSSQNLGKQIKKLRKSRKIRQKELAFLSDIPVITLQRWENGYNTPSVDVLLKVIRAMDLTLSPKK